MARYVPYVDAVQWTGTNVIEIRQFVNATPDVISSAVIRDGILYLTPANPLSPAVDVAVPIGSYVLREGSFVYSVTQLELDQRYLLAPAPAAPAAPTVAR